MENFLLDFIFLKVQDFVELLEGLFEFDWSLNPLLLIEQLLVFEPLISELEFLLDNIFKYFESVRLPHPLVEVSLTHVINLPETGLADCGIDSHFLVVVLVLPEGFSDFQSRYFDEGGFILFI